MSIKNLSLIFLMGIALSSISYGDVKRIKKIQVRSKTQTPKIVKLSNTSHIVDMLKDPTFTNPKLRIHAGGIKNGMQDILDEQIPLRNYSGASSSWILNQ